MVFYLYYRHSRRAGRRPYRGTGLSAYSLLMVYMFLNDLGYYVDISIAIKYFTYILFDQMVGCIQM